MSYYLSNLLTHTTSKYNSLRRTLLSSEDDGDTEDDTHICRVLRAYYTEKGRPYPPWLPADPNDRKAVTPQPYTQTSGYFTSAGGRSQYAGVQSSAGSNRGSLSDLWDAPSGGQTNALMQPQSLRNARRPIAPAQGSSNTLAPPQARPLPSQRAGSYQSVSSQGPSSRPGSAVDPSPPPSSGGGSAQERLKARLWGGNRSASPLPGQGANQYGGQNPYDQGGVGNGNPYDNNGGRRYPR